MKTTLLAPVGDRSAFGVAQARISVLWLLSAGLVLGATAAEAQVPTELRSPDGVIYSGAGLRSPSANQWRMPYGPLSIDASARGNVRGVEIPIERPWEVDPRGIVFERGGVSPHDLNQSMSVSFAGLGDVSLRFRRVPGRTSGDAIGWEATPSFAGATSYSAHFTDAVPNVRDFPALKIGTPTRIEDERFTSGVRTMTTTIKAHFGIVRPDVFSFVIAHDRKTLVITPDGTPANHTSYRFARMTVTFGDSTYFHPDRLVFTVVNPVYNVFAPVAPRPFPPPPSPFK